MYALVDPKSFCWSQLSAPMTSLPANQIYMTPVPVTPTYLIGGSAPQPQPLATQPQPPPPAAHVLPMVTFNQPPPQAAAPPAGSIPVPASSTSPTTPALYYSLQPPHQQQTWNPHQTYASLPAMTSTARPRTSSDDVFILETPIPVSQPLSVSVASVTNNKMNAFRPVRRQRVGGAADDDYDVMTLQKISPRKKEIRIVARRRSNSFTASSESSSNEFSPVRDGGKNERSFSRPSTRSSSRSSGRSSGFSSLRSSLSPQNVKGQTNHQSMDQSSSSGSNKETLSVELNDFSLFNIFSTSLYSALNRPESAIPLRTSSPIRGEKIKKSDKIQTVSDNVAAVVSRRSKTTKHNSENDQENGNREHVEDNGLEQQQQGSRRQKFLQALEEERDRQKSLVLPKHAPKMNCKFCKNNGESIEVYTKHRLHYKEKTVCPLLRMYVCRLCNSTGDFAHTIRHCPFNSRFDKIAWKATFL